MKNYDEALVYYDRAITVGERDEKASGIDIAYENAGACALQLHKNELAVNYLSKGLQIREHSESTERLAQILTLLGRAYAPNDPESAQTCYKRALDLYDQEKNESGKQTLVTELDQLNNQRIATLEKFYTSIENRGPSLVKADVLNSIAEIHLTLKQNKIAIVAAEEALKDLMSIPGPAETPKNRQIFRAHALLGKACLAIGSPSDAIAHFEIALRGPSPDSVKASLLNSFAFAQYFQGNTSKSSEYSKTALELAEKNHLDHEAAEAYRCRGMLAFASGQYLNSEQSINKAIQLEPFSADGRGEISNLCLISNAFIAQGKLKEAEVTLNKAIAVYDRNREVSEGGDSLWQYLNPYQDLATLYLYSNRIQDAFEILEKGRARQTIDMILDREKGIRYVLDNSPYLQRLDEQQRKLLPLVGLSDESTVKFQKVLSQRIAIIEESQRKQIRRNKFNYPDTDILKSGLDSDTAIVEYFHSKKIVLNGVLREDLWVFVLDQSGLKAIPIPISYEELWRLVIENFKLSSDSRSNLSQFRDTSSQLYRRMVEPWQKQTTAKKLILVPFGGLYFVPFSALWIADDRSEGSYFGDKYLISIYPSATVYNLLQTRNFVGRVNLLALGSPELRNAGLAGAYGEANAIGELFPTSTIITDKEATETRFRMELHNPDIIHVASHSLIYGDEPLLSFIALAPDSENDGNLELHEVYNLDLTGVSLVCLSSCQSGAADFNFTDDLVSFPQAFFVAGASSVLASLWNVDDQATRNYMTAFYRALQSGKSKAESVQIAQRLARTRWFHPAYWSAFVLFGNFT